jgi:hypothetical protein
LVPNAKQSQHFSDTTTAGGDAISTSGGAIVDDGRQQNKRAMEEAEYDKGRQKKVRRKQEWDTSAHNVFQATATKKWRKKNNSRLGSN